MVDLLVARHGGRLRKSRRERAVADEVSIAGRRVALAEPQTYMNESGQAVAPLVRRYDIDDLSRLVIVHDELDLPLGRLKVKLGGGLAGHNGLRSIKSHLHDDGFARVRIGIGKPPTKEHGADHVLSRPGKAVRETLAEMVERAAAAVESIVENDVESTMNRVQRHARRRRRFLTTAPRRLVASAAVLGWEELAR